MTKYCVEGNKVKVTYESKSKGKRKFVYDKAPIDIVLDRVRKNDNGEDYNAEGYTIVYSNGQEQTVVKHRLKPNDSNQIQFWSCGGDDWDNKQPDGSYSVWYPLPAAINRIDNTKKCPPPIPPQDYRIQIFFDNQLIHSYRSDTEITYEVDCGGCPEGYCKCDIPQYPGYCCIKKEDLVKAINDTANGVGKCCD